MARITLFFAQLFFFVCISAPINDRVHSLPGWNGTLPSPMYSGFIYGGIPPAFPNGKMYVHYCFILSEASPNTAPVIVWYNGGPGASSMFGQLIEFGPLLLNELSIENDIYNATGIPQLVRNAYSWTKIANVLIVDNPPPVGFSYCDPIGPTGNGTSCGTWNDTYVAITNKIFLENFFSSFPEFAKNDLYIMGESYAGIYVPTIVRQIMSDPNSPLNTNLKGFAVGDACIGLDVLCGHADAGPYYRIEFMHGHGQFSNELYYDIKANCPDSALRSGNLSPYCRELVNKIAIQVGGYYDYNLYDDCVGKNIFKKRVQFLSDNNPEIAFKVGGALNDYPCPTNAMDLWINLSEVRSALNVPENSYFFNGDNGVGFNYVATERNLLPFYGSVIVNSSLRTMVYNGDTDPSVNSFVTQDIYVDFLHSIRIPQKQQWRPWTIDGKKRMGGYVIEFDGNFTFLTIRGSGHMVPEFKPAAALAFLSAWISGKDFPLYEYD